MKLSRWSGADEGKESAQLSSTHQRQSLGVSIRCQVKAICNILERYHSASAFRHATLSHCVTAGVILLFFDLFYSCSGCFFLLESHPLYTLSQSNPILSSAIASGFVPPIWLATFTFSLYSKLLPFHLGQNWRK